MLKCLWSPLPVGEGDTAEVDFQVTLGNQQRLILALNSSSPWYYH